MNLEIQARLDSHGWALPKVHPPKYGYIPVRACGAFLFVSGQTARQDGIPVLQGKVGIDLDLDEARRAAELATLNLLARIEEAVGLEQVRSVAKLNGYVASASDFYEQPEVIDAASHLLVAVLGDSGNHARTAIGVNVLPINASVEVECTVELRSML